LSTFNLGATTAPTSVLLECGAVTGSSISGSGTIDGNVTVNDVGTGTSGASISAPVALGATRTFTVADDGTDATDLTISGVISGAFGVTKAGAGTIELSGSNTYTDITTISAGTLKLGATGGATNTPLGTTGSGTSVSSGAVLDLNGYTLGTAEALTLNGTGISSGGALTNSSVTSASYSGLITLGSASSIITDSGDINVTNAGTITGATFDLTLGGSGNGSVSSIIGTTSGTVTKIGSGDWTLSGANTYTGTTTISAGTLKLGATGGATNTPLGTTGSGTSVSSGAVLDLNGYTLGTAEALTLNGTGISSGGALTNSSVTSASYSGLIILGSASSIITDSGDINVTNAGTITGATFDLTLGGSGNGSVSSIIGTTSGTVTKTGTGNWTLSGANTYTGGTTITSGILTLGAADRLADAGPVTLNGGAFSTGATTGNSETVGTLTLTDNSTIALGTGVHTLTFAASDGESWTAAKKLTVTGWTGGYDGTSGTSGKIFVGASATGLTAGQLNQMQFWDGACNFVAIILSTGEVVPDDGPPPITGTTPDSRCGTGTVVLGATCYIGTINWYATSTGGASLGTGTSFTTPSITTTTTYYVDATECGSSSTPRTAVIATVNPNTWTGTVSTDWNVSGNWCSSIPVLTDDVQIPNVANKPILSTGSIGTTRNLVIDNSSSLTVNGNTIQISGTITNNGTFTASAGTVEMKGSVAQSIGAGVFAGNTISNLIISNAAGVTLGGTLNVTEIALFQQQLKRHLLMVPEPQLYQAT